jgi:hypothetical protein
VKLIKRHRKAGAIIATAAVCLSTLFSGSASAATLTALSLTPGDSTKAVANTYRIDLGSASGAAQCFRVAFSATSTFGGALPANMAFDSGGASVLQVNGATNYTKSTGTGYIQGINAGGPTPTYITISNVLNPDTAATYYAQVSLWNNATCASTAADVGTLQFAIVENTVVSVTVDPAFTFTVGNQASACNGDANYQTGAGSATGVALGSLTGGTSKSGGQLLQVGGNAGGGYTVYARTDQVPALHSAGHNWQQAAGTYPAGATVTGGQERFGFTFDDLNASGTVDDTEPADLNYMPMLTTNQAVMDGTSGTPTGDGCISYVAAAATSTPAGSYTATIIYTAVPVF